MWTTAFCREISLHRVARGDPCLAHPPLRESGQGRWQVGAVAGRGVRRGAEAAEQQSPKAGRLLPGWAAAKRSARNLLTGPEQRADNPAGGCGRAGGRRDPAPSRAPPPEFTAH